MPGDLEHRVFAGEMRADTGKRTLVGYASVFDVPAQIGDFTEIVRRGAFLETLAARADVAALVDHSPEKLIGRTRSGTLQLREDDHGLAFTISVPDTSVGHDVLVLAERGDLNGCSFGFRVAEDQWADRTHRELRSVQLVEISVITGGEPAYSQTEVAARSRSLARQMTPGWRRRYLASL